MRSETEKTVRRLRRDERQKAITVVRTLSDDDLKNVAHELGREMAQKANEMNDLRSRLDAVKMERQRRNTLTSGGLHISDHAVLRYLERYKGVDTAVIREEIAGMAKRSGRLDSGEQYSRHRDEKSGITMGINGVANIVTTVFTEAENDIFPAQS